MKKFVLPILLAPGACDVVPGPSVPAQSGQNLQSARQAVNACAPIAPQGGKDRVVASYVSSVIFGGVIVGPVGVAINEDNIRANGEADAVDRCLAKTGYKRRDLTPQEMRALNSRNYDERRALLDHLIGGGTLATFGGSPS